MQHKPGMEGGVHGAHWGQVHGGYFSDPSVVKPLVDAVRLVWAESHPEVIVDLGGGTGYLLSRLRQAGIGPETARVTLDCSPAQLDVAGATGATTVRGSVADFHRSTVVPQGCKALFLMRSVLHYAGLGGLTPLLRHIRAQMEPGEHWIHQTACFERPEDADGLNSLYRQMRTEKEYPTVADLQSRLEESGWRVEAVSPAPTLRLESGDLGRRYGLTEPDLQHIGEAMADEFGTPNDVFHLGSNGFWAELRYRIFVCRAVK